MHIRPCYQALERRKLWALYLSAKQHLKNTHKEENFFLIRKENQGLAKHRKMIPSEMKFSLKKKKDHLGTITGKQKTSPILSLPKRQRIVLFVMQPPHNRKGTVKASKMKKH